jgi:hypothetical protein
MKNEQQLIKNYPYTKQSPEEIKYIPIDQEKELKERLARYLPRDLLEVIKTYIQL